MEPQTRKTAPISAHLTRRMGPLSIFIAILISILAPGIYHVMENRASGRMASQHAQYLSDRFRTIVAENPKLWKYQAQKYLQVLHTFVPNKGIVAIRVVDESARPVTQYDFRCSHNTPPKWKNLTQRGSAMITFNNRKIGAIEVEISSHQVLMKSIFFFLPSLCLGIGIALFAYLFPARVVRRLEKDNQALMDELQKSYHGLETRVKHRTADLFKANVALQQQVKARKKSQAELAEARNHLEERVASRTADLTVANQQLTLEINSRILAEKALRTSKERLRHLSSKLLIVQEQERRRIAMEIHDSLATTLSAIKFGIQKTRRDMRQGAASPAALTKQITAIQLAIDESRRIMSGLHPSSLDELGIIATLEWYCADFREHYEHITVKTAIGLQEGDIPEPIKVVIFRLTQEGFHNVARHSMATCVNLALRKLNGRIEFAVSDNGKGFDMKTAKQAHVPTRGLGILSMKERTENSGGSFSIESSLGSGTTIRARWLSAEVLPDTEHAA